MTFAAPKYLYLLLTLPVATLVFLLIMGYVQAVRRQFQTSELLRLSRASTRLRYVRMAFLFLVGAASLILALAEPRIEQEVRKEIYQKVDVIIVLDTSLSMRTRDIMPSRMEKAREELQNFIIHKVGTNIGRIGLVSFAGTSVLLSYLTRDPSNILFYLDYAQAETQPTFGTDISGGIKNGLKLLEKEQELDPALKATDVIFIVVSDGEDNGKDMQPVVSLAAEKGIRIYCIGFGSQTGGYIPIGEKDGEIVYLADERGKKIVATFNEGTLRWMAAATRGLYYRSINGTELYTNLNDILWNAREVVGVETVNEQTPLHHWFLMGGFAALAIFLIA